MANWTLLAQIDSDDRLGMMWGDVGTLYWLTRRQDLDEGPLKGSTFTWQCSWGRSRSSHQLVGDADPSAAWRVTSVPVGVYEAHIAVVRDGSKLQRSPVRTAQMNQSESPATAPGLIKPGRMAVC